MAFIKYSVKSYLTVQDFLNLLKYLVSEEKFPIVSTTYPVNRYASLEYIAYRWNYMHMYHHAEDMTLCYHYVLSFDLDNEYRQLYNINPKQLLRQIRILSPFQGMDLFLAIHRSPRGYLKHVHIIVDSIHARTGKKTFINMDNLKEELGILFYPYNIAFSGYTYMMNNRLLLGNEPPHRLYYHPLY